MVRQAVAVLSSIAGKTARKEDDGEKQGGAWASKWVIQERSTPQVGGSEEGEDEWWLWWRTDATGMQQRNTMGSWQGHQWRRLLFTYPEWRQGLVSRWGIAAWWRQKRRSGSAAADQRGMRSRVVRVLLAARLAKGLARVTPFSGQVIRWNLYLRRWRDENYFWGNYDRYKRRFGEAAMQGVVKQVQEHGRVNDADRETVEVHRVEWCVGAILTAATVWRRLWDAKEAQWQQVCRLHWASILAEAQRRHEQELGGRKSGMSAVQMCDLDDCNLENRNIGQPLDEQGCDTCKRRPWIGFRDEETGLQKDPGR